MGLVFERNRFEGIALRVDGANDARVWVPERDEFAHTGIGFVGGHAGQQAARGLWVKYQGVAGMFDRRFRVANRPAQTHVGGLQRAQNTSGHGFFGPG